MFVVERCRFVDGEIDYCYIGWDREWSSADCVNEDERLPEFDVVELVCEEVDGREVGFLGGHIGVAD